MKKAEKKFWKMILRNGAILSVLQVITIWGASPQSFSFFNDSLIWKSIIIFFLGYLVLESAKFYKLDLKAHPNLKKPKMLIFS